MIIQINPRVDVVFHNLFGSIEHPQLTMSFVNSLLGKAGLPKAVELTIANPFQLARFIDQKESELDIMYRDENHREVQLEMQIMAHTGLEQRMLHNWTQMYQRQLLSGQEYYEHRPAISVWILDEVLFGDETWIQIFRCRSEDTLRVLHDDLCIITIELPLWQKLFKTGKEGILDPLGKWLYFLTHAKGSDRDELLSRLGEPTFEEAVDMIKEFSEEQKLRHAYDMRENYERLVNTYIGTGYKKGIQTERRNLARKLKATGMPLEQISALTELTIEEVGAL